MAIIVDQSGQLLAPDGAGSVERKYKAATPGARNNLPVPSRSGNAVMEHARGRLRDWGRQLEENHDLSAQMIRLKARAASRLDIVPMTERRDGTPHEELNQRLAKLFARWGPKSDALGLEAWPRHCELIAASAFRDGDVFVRHLLGDVVRGRRIHYSIASYEADFVPFDLVRVADSGARIVHGIESDAMGRPVAAWFYPSHPSGLDVDFALKDMIRVPWGELSQLRRSRRLGQYRGASELAPAILRLANVDDYETSEQWAAKVAGSVAVQLIRSPDTEAFDSSKLDTSYGARTQELQGGLMLDNLAPGEEWKVIDTSRPNPELSNFRESQLRAATAGVGVSYSETTNDYSGSYSSQRQELVTTRNWYRDDATWFKNAFLADVQRNFVTVCILQQSELGLGSMLAQADPDSLFEFDTIPEATPSIDPAKEKKGDELELAMGTESRAGIIRKNGRSPERVDRERAADVAPGLGRAGQDQEETDDASQAEEA